MRKKLFLFVFVLLLSSSFVLSNEFYTYRDVRGFSHSYNGIDSFNFQDRFDLGEQHRQLEYNGYIIEFYEDPFFKAEARFKEEKERTFNQIVESYGLGFRSLKFAPVNEFNYDKKIEGHKVNLDREHEQVRGRIFQEIGLEGVMLSPSDKNVLKREFKKAFNGIVLDISDEEAKKIESVRGVKKVWPNRIVEKSLMNSVPLIQDNVLAGQLDEDGNDCSVSGKTCLTGEGVTIAIIDTGVDYTHEDLGGCSTGEFLEGNCAKVVGGWDFVNNDNDPMDDQGHGTHVAATAAGDGVLKGVAPDAKILGFKVLDSRGYGNWEGIIAGVERAVIDDADILSLSLGGGGNPDDPLSQAVDNAVLAGKVVVVAAGNSGPWEQTIGSPGTARKAITVGASDNYDLLASFSSRGPVTWIDENGNEKAIVKPDVLAPGFDICAAQSNNKPWNSALCSDYAHVEISGTSMATPHIAGVVALLKQKHPDWTPEEIKSSIKATAIDLGYSAIEQGAGRINVSALVSLDESYPLSEIYLVFQEDKIKFIGTAKSSEGLEYYRLYLGNDVLVESKREISGEVIYTLNRKDYLDGDYVFVFEVKSFNGKVGFYAGVINIENIFIKSLQSNDIYRTGDSIDLILSEIVYPEFNLNIFYSKSFEDNWIEANFNKKINLDTKSIGFLDTSSFDDGFYKFKFVFEIPNLGFIEKEIKDIYFDSSLKKGWPQRIDYSFCKYDPNFCWPGFLEPSILNQDGNIKIALKPHYNTHFHKDAEVILFNPNGIINLFNSLERSKGMDLKYPLFGDFYLDSKNKISTAKGIYELTGKIVSLDETVKTYFDFNGTRYLVIFDEYSRFYRGEYTFKIIDSNSQLISELNLPEETTSCVHPQEIFIVSIENLPKVGIACYIDKVLAIYLFNLNGSVLSGWPIYIDIPFFTPSFFSSGDINKNGKPEIIIETTSGTYIYNSEGMILEGWPFENSGFRNSAIALLDVNNDGNLEVALTRGFNVYLIDHGGNVLDGWPIQTDWPIYGGLVAGDITNDGFSNIVSVAGTKIYAWNLDGSLVKDFPKIMENGAHSLPIIADINGNGKIELIATSYADYSYLVGSKFRGSVYVWELDAPYNPNKMDWPMFQHDPQHTGCYKCFEEEPIVVENSKIKNNQNQTFIGNLNINILKFDGSVSKNYQGVVNKVNISIPAYGEFSIKEIFNSQTILINEPGKYGVEVIVTGIDGKGFKSIYEFSVI